MVKTRDISLTFMKGMAVLKVFDETQASMSLADISRRTGLDAATVRRLVLTLVELGYVRKERRMYALTPRVLVLAAGFLRGHQIGRLVQPVLNRYAEDIGLGVVLAMRDDDHALLVAESTVSGSPVTFGFTLGSRLPILQTAIGRMLLACGEADDAARVVETAPIGAPMNDTEAARAEVGAHVARAAEQRYCLVQDAFEIGVIGVSVPIETGGEVQAVLGVSGVRSRFRGLNGAGDVVAALRNCAVELAQSDPFGVTQ